MSELADDMMNGFSCSWCGIYFKEEHGYPVICNDCYQNWHKKNEINTSKKLLKEYCLQVAFIKEL